LAAVDRLKSAGVRPARPLGLAVFPEEEGSRFGIACLGSRLLTGDISPERAAALTDPNGVTFAEAATRHGLDPHHLGVDRQALDRIGLFLELHVEQGRGLIDLNQPVAIGTSILGHGRWRLTVTGQGNHAGTTLMTDRQDPMVAAGAMITAVRDVAAAVPDARATVGRLQPVPGGTNVIASTIHVWLDVRHPSDAVTADVVRAVHERARTIAATEGCTVELVEESLSPTVHFDSALRDRLSGVLPEAPLLATGAGHDAGVLSAHLPTGMLFVRNPTGVSHSPAEHVDDVDADAGADALAATLQDLLGDPA
jgi:N-carbamoyl-L-amino-acid hydrolase